MEDDIHEKSGHYTRIDVCEELCDICFFFRTELALCGVESKERHFGNESQSLQVGMSI